MPVPPAAVVITYVNAPEFHALYKGDDLITEGGWDYVNGETARDLCTALGLGFQTIHYDEAWYERHLNGNGYPQTLTELLTLL